MEALVLRSHDRPDQCGRNVGEIRPFEAPHGPIDPKNMEDLATAVKEARLRRPVRSSDLPESGQGAELKPEEQERREGKEDRRARNECDDDLLQRTSTGALGISPNISGA
jgi:hypothetical protein